MTNAGGTYAVALLAFAWVVTAGAQGLPVSAWQVEGVTSKLGSAGGSDDGRVSHVFPGTRAGPGASEVSSTGRTASLATDTTASSSTGRAMSLSNVRSTSLKAEAAAGQAGITYICDATINTIAGLCSTLNSTIASLYTSVFYDASATIYIQFGSTGLGQSQFPVQLHSYTDYRNALQASVSSANDATAFANSVPPVDPLGVNALVRLTNPNARALGFSPTIGYMADARTCTLGTGGCYDGIITISYSIQSAGRFYYRSGQIGSGQYDFFSVVEHETNEVLGTSSCAFGCPANRIFPADLYRYQSNHERSFASGNNDSCSAPHAGNACFSLDGVNVWEQYYNIDDGHDAGDWVPNCTFYQVQDATGCPGVAGRDISTIEVLVLDVIGYTSLAVTNQQTSQSTSVVSGTCVNTTENPAFPATWPEVWMNVAVTGAKTGDLVSIVFSRPDGTVQTTVRVSPTFQGQIGAACVSGRMAISGTSAASFLGSWTVSVYWNQYPVPVAKLSFTIYLQCYVLFDVKGQMFSAAGGTGSVNFTVPELCPWRAISESDFVSLLGYTSGTGNGSVTFQVAPNPGGFRTGGFLVGTGENFLAEDFNIEQAPVSFPGMAAAGSLAHITSEGTWNYRLNAVNLGASWATVRFNFWNDLGLAQMFPFTLTSWFPPFLAATLDRTISPNAQLTLNTAGADNVAPLTASGQVLASGNVGVFGIFSDPTYGWNAVVPVETRNAARYVMAFDNTTAGSSTVGAVSASNVLATGVAVANVAATPANIPVTIRDDTGAQIVTTTISLAAQGHTSFMLNQKYTMTANRRGTIEFDTPNFGTQNAGQISVLGLRANGPALTTLPVLASSDVPGGAIAHVAYNGGFTSVFYVVNTGSAAASFTLSFFDEAGNGLTVPLLLPQSGTAATTSALTRTLAAGAMVVVETVANDAAASVVGSAQLTTDGGVSGFEIFRWTTFGQEASVPVETRTPASFVLVFDDTNGLTTGVALSNVAAAGATVTAKIYDDAGSLLQTASLNLAGKGHTSFLLPDPARYPITANRRGMVEFVVPPGGKINAVGLRAKSDGTLTTIPVLVK